LLHPQSTKRSASITAARETFSRGTYTNRLQWHHLSSSGKYCARRIRYLAAIYARTGELDVTRNGSHSKKHRIIDIDFVRADCLQFLDSHRRIQPILFNKWLIDYLPANGFDIVSVQTSRKWLIELGFKKQTRKKGVYYDGHDREDVQTFLHQQYLPFLDRIEPSRAQYIGDDLTVVIEPQKTDAPQIRVAYHDECIYHSNDITDTYYARDDYQELPKKGMGRCLHVSDFVFECCGFLNLEKIVSPDRLSDLRERRVIPAQISSRVIIYPGKNADAWWDCQQLLLQCRVTLDLFELAYPGDVMCAIFDCSSNHQAFADDALVVSRMNVNPGGKQPSMHDTKFVPLDQVRSCLV
jgi:hypothetical protein